jgi:hypothetical protein
MAASRLIAHTVGASSVASKDTGEIGSIDDRRMVRRIRFATGCRRGNSGESRSQRGLLDCATQREKHVSSMAFFSADKFRVRPFCGHWIFSLFWGHQFRRLGGGNCRVARALAMAGAPGHRWNGVLLRGRSGGGHRNSAVRWSSEERISSLAETHTHSLLFNADSCVHSRTLEPDWYPTGVAICPARNSGGEVSGLLWLRYYIPKGTVPRRRPDGIERSDVWITVAVVLSLLFVFVLGRGIVLHR